MLKQHLPDSQSTQNNAPQHQLSITGLEITTYPPGAQPPTGSRRRASDDRKKVTARAYTVRSPPRKSEVVAKMKLFLEKEAPPGTAVGATTLTANLGAGAFSGWTTIDSDVVWTQMLSTMKDNVHKTAKFNMEWTKEAPIPTPPPTPEPAVPTAAAPTQVPATQPFSFTAASPPPPYQAPSSAASGSRSRAGATTARGRARQHAEEMDHQRNYEVEEDRETAIAIMDHHPRCQQCSNGHIDNTHCYIDGGDHYPLTHILIAMWATAVREQGASLDAPPPHVFQRLVKYSPRAGGPQAAHWLASEARATVQSALASGSTAAAATSSSSSGNAGLAPSASSGPIDMGNAKAWTVWGLDKRDGGLNKGLATSLFKQNVKTMSILARASQRGVLDKDFELTGVEMMIIEQWIEDWRVLEEDESSVERENSIIEMRAAVAGE